MPNTGTTRRQASIRSTTLGRVREYLQRMAIGERLPLDDWQIRHDLSRLWNHLAKVRALGHTSVEVSPQLDEAFRAYRICGSELLVVDHGKKRA